MAERAHPEDPGFQGTIYERRMHDRYRFAARYVSGKDVLDAACGTCWGWLHLGEARSLTGFDVSPEALREARRLGFAERVAAAEMDALPFPAAAFDVVVCLEAIEHVPLASAQAFLAECRRVLRPDGLLVLSTPLRRNGRHSGNPWHLAEYAEEEIRSLLDGWFEDLDSCVDTEGQDAPPVFLFAGRLRSEPAAAPFRWVESGMHERAAQWLESLATGSGFRFAPEGEATVTSTAIGVLLAEGLGKLADLPAPREALVRTLKEAQEEATGLFVEPLAAKISLEGGLHDEEYFHWMTTYFALHALDALQEKPEYPLRFLDFLSGRESVYAWLEQLDWSNPWRESNRVMQLMAALLFRLQWEGEPAAAERYHDVLDWLDERQDPHTGLWGTEKGASLLNAVAGAYHFVPFYRYARRPVRAWSKIVDACLALQQEDGLFGPSPGGGACEDLDAIDLLCTAARIRKRLDPEIRRALTRAFWAIRNLQREDGSFPYAGRTGAETYRFSSWPAMEAKTGGGDIFATWFRLAALHTIRSLLGEDLPAPGQWIFRRLPALGFHLRDTAIPADAEPAHRAIRFRPLPAPARPAAPTAAVVVTCFNLGEYLHEALASVCRQTLADVETVIIDDGSTDPYTVARLDALAADGWRVIRTENRGLPAARNLGIRETRAPYICCLDADDRLRPLYLEKAVALLEAAPEAGFVSCFYELFDEQAGQYRYTRPRLPEMLAHNEAAVSSVFRRQAWLDAGGYCETLPAMQDWDFWISILEKGWRGELLPEVLFDYRIRAGSMYSETKRPKNYSRITGMIAARHAELYRQYCVDVARIKARDLAENIAWSERQGKAMRELNRWARQLGQANSELASQIRALGEMARKEAAAREKAEAAVAAVAVGLHGVQSLPGGLETRLSEALQRDSELQALVRRLEEKLAEALAPLRGPEAETPDASGIAEPKPPRLLRTAVWALLQALHPRGKWRALRNLALLGHVLASSEKRKRWYSLFDPPRYGRKRPDVVDARIHVSVHYALAGAWEQVQPSDAFDGEYYWRRHPDVKEAGLNPLLHYVVFGAAEGRAIAPAGSWAMEAGWSQAMQRPGGFDLQPLVSVVIPCFNYGRFVEEAIASVQRQTFRNLEIIVVEGGSTDAETRAIVRRLERARLPRTRILYRDQPCLVGDNRNFGIAAARGKYVCCLDADDILDPRYLETAVFLAEFGPYDFVSASTRSFGDENCLWLLTEPRWPDILKENQVSTIAFFRREIWEMLGGYRDWGKGEQYLPEDWDFWIRCVASGFRGAAIRLPMMHYRVKPGSLSRNRTVSYAEWVRRMAAVHADLAGLEAPRPRPALSPRAASWPCLEDDPADAGAVMMALPFFTEGGAERIFAALAREWRRQGVKVVVVTTLALAPESPDRLDVLRRETPYVYPLAGILEGREDRMADFVYFLLRRHRIRLVYMAGCDLMYRLLPQIRQEFPHIAVVDQLFNDEVHFHSNRAFCDFIDCTVVPGRKIADKLVREYKEKESRIAVIPHGVALPAAEGSPGVRPPALPPGFENKPLVCFFGRWSAEKAPLDFVNIAALVRSRFPQARFVMTGDGPEKKAVEQAIRLRALGRDLLLPGFVEDVQPWIAAADVVVVPSRLDGMPLIVFEAQGLGKPVVASRTGSIPEVIEDGVTGVLCDPGDIEGFAAAVCRLLEDGECRKRIGEAARTYAWREHRQEVMLERYYRLFERWMPAGQGARR